MSLKTRERLNATNGTDFDANIGNTPIIFKIDPNPNKIVDLSSVVFTALLDTNALITYRAPLTCVAGDGYSTRLQTADHSFKFPGGITSLLGRIRVQTLSGEVLEEIEGVNIYAQSRQLSLSTDEAAILAHNEMKNIETNFGAFISQTGAPTTLGYGNSPGAQGTGVNVNQLSEFRFQFGSLGGFMSGGMFPLVSGLEIYVYFAEFKDQRVYSGAYLDQQSRVVMNLQATGGANGTTTLSTLFSGLNSLNAITDIGLASRKMMISGNIAANNSYTEEGAYVYIQPQQNVPSVTVDPTTGVATFTVSKIPTPLTALPAPITNKQCTITPIDFQTKRVPTVDKVTTFNGTTNAGPAYIQDFKAHSAGIATMGQNSTTCVLITNEFNGPAIGPTVQFTPRSGFGHLGMYPNRLVKILACQATNSSAYQYDIRKITGIAYDPGTGIYTITFDAAFVWTAAPVNPNNGANPAVITDTLGEICLCGPSDLVVTGTPIIRRAAIEYEYVTGKVSKKMIFESRFIKTEIYNILKDSMDSFITSMTQCKKLDGILACFPYGSYDLDTTGFSSVLPLLNGKNLSDQPIKLKSSYKDSSPPNEVIYMYEMATGMPVKRPHLMSYLGQSFDYTSLPCLSTFPDFSVVPQVITDNFTSSNAYIIGIPCNGADTFENRIQLKFTGKVLESGPLYMFHLHRRDVIITPDGRVTMD